MNSDNITYLIFTLFSIILSFKYGKERFIGVTWSIIFSLFCPIASIGIILLSKKKDRNNAPPNVIKWGIVGFLLLFLKLSGEGSELNVTRAIYESIDKLTLPYSVFVHNISSQEIGYFSADNMFTILPFYFILRNYTLKHLP